MVTTIPIRWNKGEEVPIKKLTILNGICGSDKLQLFQRYTAGCPIEYLDMPETGLTQKGQFDKGMELAYKASEFDSDQFLIIETHSEHILNAIRIAVIDGVISAKDIQIYFIKRTGENTSELFEPIIDEWPKGFFDQQEIELAQIFSGQRNKK